MVVDTKEIFFNRGEDGKLLAREVVLAGIEGNPTVKIRPLTRGKLQEIQAMTQSKDDAVKAESDKVLLLAGLVEPEVTEAQLVDMKPQFATAIATAILAVSLGISQEDVQSKTQEALVGMEEDALKKK